MERGFLDRSNHIVLEDCLDEIKKWMVEDKLNDFMYIHPEKVRKSSGNYKDVPASDLTYKVIESVNDIPKCSAHFVGVKLWDGHEKGQFIKTEFINNLSSRSENISGNALAQIYQCLTDITTKHGYLREVRNEAGVRFTYGDPLVSMLCEAFHYTVELEDTIDEAQQEMNVSKQSKADYTCWMLRKVETVGKQVCVVIMETKHLEEIRNKDIAQTLGYYCKSRAARDFDQPGVAILLNEFNGKVDARIFTFPYRNDAGQPGIQALMFPANQHEHFIDSFSI